MYYNDESQTDIGSINLHKDAITSIALIAATETEGVKGVDKDLQSMLLEFTGYRRRAIHVSINKNDQVSLSIPLIIKYGYNIPDIAYKCQENVRNALEKSTNLSVKDINIIVRGVSKE
jgi:uncharacterized alkaline shock family protein YloU